MTTQDYDVSALVEHLGLKRPPKIYRYDRAPRSWRDAPSVPYGAFFHPDEHAIVYRGQRFLRDYVKRGEQEWRAFGVEKDYSHLLDITENLAHELVHAEQRERYASADEFVAAYNDANWWTDYENNRFEVEARERAKTLKHLIRKAD